jgi:hypothetical protein
MQGVLLVSYDRDTSENLDILTCSLGFLIWGNDAEAR